MHDFDDNSTGGGGRCAPCRRRAAPRLAVPSWVIPGTVYENCLFLAGKADEVGLLFLETAPCLAYGRQDLPPDLADLSLTFHVHLPGDLPWTRGGGAVAAICLALMDKVAFLGVRRAVLHPPVPARGDAPRKILDDFARSWCLGGRQLDDVLLENIRGNDLTGLQGMFGPGGFGLCPDLGHILAYGQYALLDMLATLPKAAAPRMLHCSAPGKALSGGAGAHLPLDVLDGEGLDVGRTLCSLLADGGIIVAELFDWGYVARSLPIIEEWLAVDGPDEAG